MIDETPGMTLKSIGTVRSKIKQKTRRKFKDLLSEIVVDPALTEGLDDLSDFSHIIVIFWMHQRSGEVPLKVRPRGNPALSLTGVFATRSPDRPNPLGKSTVELIQRRDNILTVKGLDAIDGTPVIDIKPYIPGYDSVESARAPSWVIKP